ncbi:MAG TPA: response regulator transcription factor [Terrimesophilobacter sp.]|nr:response regulator transcription factor [Terrimesophilobacter sp.]
MRLLIVEDDPEMSAALSTGLGAEGFVVDVASNGVDGLWMATENAFDLVVLDIMLPQLSGYEVCRRLREARSTVPILMLTAKDGEYDQADALDLGADDYLSKPFSYVVLLARIRALLRRAPADRSPTLVLGDLSLNPATRQCHRGETEIALTSREFDLLEYLIRNRNVVVSRASIAEHVWDAELDIESNVVEVYVSHLRQKIDNPFGRRDIETVRGAGYRLTESKPAAAKSPAG